MFEDFKVFFEKVGVEGKMSNVFDAYFNQAIVDVDRLIYLSKDLRESVKQEELRLVDFDVVKVLESKDSVKFLLRSLDGFSVECVLMLHGDGRRTICVSSQVFCALGCKFCATGANKFKRSLSEKEILDQIVIVNSYLRSKQESEGVKFKQMRFVSNVVFMGMGEPFLNYESLVGAIGWINDKKGFNIGARKIVVSTAGIVPKIYEFADLGLQVRLAISLHASNDELRSFLMPINKRYGLGELFEAVDYFFKKTGKRVSFEYVLIDGVNDSRKDALELASLLEGRVAFVNLLVYNAHEFADFKKPSVAKVMEFKKVLDSRGVDCAIRKSLGDEVDGACGQLSGKNS